MSFLGPDKKSAQIIIPGVNATLLPTFTPTPLPTNTPVPTEPADDNPTTMLPTVTSTPFVFAEVAPPPVDNGDDTPSTFGDSPQRPKEPLGANDLLAITAAAVTGAYIATQRKRETATTGDEKVAEDAVASDGVLQGSAAAAAIAAFKAQNEERMRREEEAQQRAAARQARERGADGKDSAARRRAEKEGRLGAFLRDRRKSREAAKRAEADRIRQKDEKKRAEKKREQSGLTGKELREKEAQQAIWDANGRAIYDANQEFEETHGFQMDAATREQAIKDATVGGVFNAGLYATNLQASAQQKKEDDPYAGMENYYESQDKKMAEEVAELQKWAAIQRLKDAELDSATLSYIAMAQAAENGELSPEDYDKAREEIINRLLGINSDIAGRSRIYAGWAADDYFDTYWRAGTDPNLALLHGIGPASMKALKTAGINTVGDLASADPAVVKQILREAQNADLRRVSNSNWQQQALNAAGDPPSNIFSSADGLNYTADIMSLGGNMIYGATGWKPASTVADLGDGLGTIGGVGQVAQNWKPAWDFITKGPVVKTTSRFGRFFGPLAILTGGFSMADGISNIGETTQDGHWGADSTAALMDTIAGATAVAGGIALVIPGAQPVAGVLFGVSAISSGVSAVAGNWDAITLSLSQPSPALSSSYDDIITPSYEFTSYDFNAQSESIPMEPASPTQPASTQTSLQSNASQTTQAPDASNSTAP